MGATALEVADVLRKFLPTYERRFGSLSPHPQRVARDLIVCRTAELGGHRYVCDHCEHVVERYNSCLAGRAGTGTAPSARTWSGSAGSKHGGKTCCRCRTSIWSLRFRTS